MAAKACCSLTGREGTGQRIGPDTVELTEGRVLKEERVCWGNVDFNSYEEKTKVED